MLILVQFDLTKANLACFDAYETQVLARLDHYGGRWVERLRSIDGQRETHILDFPDAVALTDFRADPVRMSLQNLWQQCGATSELMEVVRYN